MFQHEFNMARAIYLKTHSLIIHLQDTQAQKEVILVNQNKPGKFTRCSTSSLPPSRFPSRLKALQTYIYVNHFRIINISCTKKRKTKTTTPRKIRFLPTLLHAPNTHISWLSAKADYNKFAICCVSKSSSVRGFARAGKLHAEFTFTSTS